MSAFAFRDAPRRQVTLNVTPLIDVLFLLIIFFTLTSTFKRAGELELELPGSSTSAPTADEPDPAEVEVVLLNTGAILLNGNAVARDQLKAQLTSARNEDPAQRVRLLAEADVPHGEVIHLLDLVRNAGFPGAAIGTHREDPADSG